MKFKVKETFHTDVRNFKPGEILDISYDGICFKYKTGTSTCITLSKQNLDKYFEKVEDNMKFDLEKIKNNVIHCDTEKKAKILINFITKQGFEWLGEKSCWDNHKKNTCYRLNTTYNRLTFQSIENFKNGNFTILEFEDVIIQDKPRICEILGLEVEERFKIKGIFLSPLCIDKNGHIQTDSMLIPSAIHIFNIIQNPELIETIPKYTEKQKEMFKALKVLGFKYLARDKNKDIVSYTYRPFKTEIDWDFFDGDYFEIPQLLNIFPFIDWEDEEPFEIPTID